MMAELINTAPNSTCSEKNILELFVVNQTLTDSQVLDTVNDPNAVSLITGMGQYGYFNCTYEYTYYSGLN